MDTTCHGTGNHRFSPFSAATASSRLRRLAVVAAAFAAMSATPVQADQWSLLLNGKAWHLEKPAGTNYNEKNWGAGVQYDFKITDSKWIPFVTASGFKDSNKNPSYYAGGGALRRFSFGEEKTSVHLDAGVVAFLMTRKDYNDGKPFPGLLPVVSFGTDRVALNITYIPKVDPKMVPIIFFQLKIGLN
jgi:Antimicrobial peptide resistance and lipid A acylation protein PagP